MNIKSFKSSTKSPNNSNYDLSRDSDESDDPTAKLIIKVKNLRQSFIGNYMGRELVKHGLLPEYKDIVIVDKDEDIIPTLNEIYDHLHPQLATTWLGITRSTVDDEVQNYKLWVNLNGTPIGRHRFQLRAIKVNEACIQLKLRVLNEFDTSPFRSSGNCDTYSLVEEKEMSIYHNLCEITKFTVVLIMSIVTIASNLLWHCADYSLKLIHELTKLINVTTPIIFGILDFLSKCVGGFYWLIYMLWHGNSDPVPKFPSTALKSPPLAIMPKPTSAGKNITLPKSYSYDLKQRRNLMRT